MIGRRGLGTERQARPGAQAVEAHQARDAIFRAALAARPQFAGHARTAVAAGVAVSVDALHRLDELLVGSCPSLRRLRSCGVVARARHVQGFTKFGELEVFPHGIDQRIPLCGSSESMLMAFFKISRWRRR